LDNTYYFFIKKIELSIGTFIALHSHLPQETSWKHPWKKHPLKGTPPKEHPLKKHPQRITKWHVQLQPVIMSREVSWLYHHTSPAGKSLFQFLDYFQRTMELLWLSPTSPKEVLQNCSHMVKIYLRSLLWKHIRKVLFWLKEMLWSAQWEIDQHWIAAMIWPFMIDLEIILSPLRKLLPFGEHLCVSEFHDLVYFGTLGLSGWIESSVWNVGLRDWGFGWDWWGFGWNVEILVGMLGSE